MKISKLIFALPLAAAFLNIGCSQVRSYQERELLYSRIVREDFRQAVEDFDLLIMMDQKTHLSRWRED